MLYEGFFINEGLSNFIPGPVVGVLGRSEVDAAVMAVMVADVVVAEGGAVIELKVGVGVEAVEDEVGGGIASEGLVKAVMESDNLPGRGEGWMIRLDSDSFHAFRRASEDSNAFPF